MQKRHIFGFKARLKAIFHLASYVILALFSLSLCFFFLYFAIAGETLRSEWTLWVFGSFASLSLLLYLILSLLSFLPLKQTFSHFKKLDILFLATRSSLILSSSFILPFLYSLTDSSWASGIAVYAISLMVIEIFFFVYGLLSYAWFKENPTRYSYQKEKEDDSNLPLDKR